MRIVLDTNLLCSAILSKKTDSSSVLIIEARLSAKFQVAISQEIEAEYRDVLGRPEFLTRPLTGRVITALDQRAPDKVSFTANPNASAAKCGDPTDQKFLDLGATVAAGTLAIVTNDRTLLGSAPAELPLLSSGVFLKYYLR